jgi:hypothetical protein
MKRLLLLLVVLSSLLLAAPVAAQRRTIVTTDPPTVEDGRNVVRLHWSDGSTSLAALGGTPGIRCDSCPAWAEMSGAPGTGPVSVVLRTTKAQRGTCGPYLFPPPFYCVAYDPGCEIISYLELSMDGNTNCYAWATNVSTGTVYVVPNPGMIPIPMSRVGLCGDTLDDEVFTLNVWCYPNLTTHTIRVKFFCRACVTVFPPQ